MTDEQLRALVRDVVEKRLGARGARLGARGSGLEGAGSRKPEAGTHPSHYLYLTLVNTSDACVIEPSVSCDHCGYCKSHGH